MSIQTENGKRDEKDLCVEIFQRRHYFAYNCPRSRDGGQPVDVFAFKGVGGLGLNIVFMVDAKNVAKGKKSFRFSRVEQNQEISMGYAIEWANVSPRGIGFVIFFEDYPDSPKFLSYDAYRSFVSEGRKSVNVSELPDFSFILDFYDIAENKLEINTSM